MIVVVIIFGKSISFGGIDVFLDDDFGIKIEKFVVNMVFNVLIIEFIQSLSNMVKRFFVQVNVVNLIVFEGEFEGEKIFVGFKMEVVLFVFSCDYFGFVFVQEEWVNFNVVQVVFFDLVVKYMVIVVKFFDGRFCVYVKGVFEILLGKCFKVIVDVSFEEFFVVDMMEDDCEMFVEIIILYVG